MVGPTGNHEYETEVRSDTINMIKNDEISIKST